jgi:hypothetical protein
MIIPDRRPQFDSNRFLLVEELFRQAYRMGFEVGVQSRTDSILLLDLSRGSKIREWSMVRQGRRLLKQLPGERGRMGPHRGKRVGVGSGLRYDKNGQYHSLVVSVSEVEHSYWMAASSLVVRQERQKDYGLQFDRLVEDEIRRHPDILRVEALIRAHPRQGGLRLELEQLEFDLRVELQQQRDIFLFVVDPQEA